jgi:hypothetical protein
MKLCRTLALLACAYGMYGQPGPAVGVRVPDFAALDQNGQSRTLQSLMGSKGLMLVFYRSADW